jgi:hypothetical protein
MRLIYVLHKAYIWKHCRLTKEPSRDRAWRASKYHRSFTNDSYKVGLAEWAVHWIGYYHKPASDDKSGYTESDLRSMAPAFKRVFFPAMDLHEVSRAFVPLVSLIN